MKTFFVAISAFYILFFTYNEIMNIKKAKNEALQIKKVILSMKTSLRYKDCDFEELCRNAINDGGEIFAFKENKLILQGSRNQELIKVFNEFISKIGTTDRDGQIAICAEYFDVADNIYTELKTNEKSKIQVNTALGILGAVSLIVFFI